MPSFGRSNLRSNRYDEPNARGAACSWLGVASNDFVGGISPRSSVSTILRKVHRVSRSNELRVPPPKLARHALRVLPRGGISDGLALVALPIDRAVTCVLVIYLSGMLIGESGEHSTKVRALARRTSSDEDEEREA